jgi:hypothetical protein
MEQAMTTWKKALRFFLPATLLGMQGLLAAGLLLWVTGPAASVSSLNAGQAPPVDTYPAHVLIIRHAEKPDDEADKHLTSRGAARAAALPSLFYIPKAFRTKPAPFPTPDFIFATAKSKHSNRPVETVQPLAKALGDVAIHAKYADDEYQSLVDHFFSNEKHAGKVILICWHHGKIPDLTRAVLARAKNADKVKKQVPERWEPGVFDRIWQITFDNQGKAAYVDRPQSLLFKDDEK